MSLTIVDQLTNYQLPEGSPVVPVVIRGPWKHADQTTDEITERVADILGYDPKLIAKGETTTPMPGAMSFYEELMMETLGYVLQKSPAIPPMVQRALDEIEAGDTTFAVSAEEFDAQLRDSESSDDQ